MPNNSLTMPSWFLAHGAPLHVMGQSAVTQFWQTLGDYLPRKPRAVLCLSAHWLTEQPAFGGYSNTPSIQYDFSGFPDQLYHCQWPLHSDHRIAESIKSELETILPNLHHEPDRAIDHGVWVPLSQAWPNPDFPIYQLSICPQRGAAWHIQLGQSLASLCEQDILIIGSGGIVHNLRRLDWRARPGVVNIWAEEFMLALEAAMAENDEEALCDPWSMPHGHECVPTMEHYLPMLVVYGIHQRKALAPLFRDWEYGNLALHSYTTLER